MARSSISWKSIAPYVLIASCVWVSDFFHMGSFGLYEDDLTLVPRAISMSSRELGTWIWTWVTNLYGHGRPLSDSFIALFSHIGFKMAGLSGIYWIGYAIVAANALLFYHLLRRLGSDRFALLGGLAFALFPADTTQPYLTHSLGLQPSLTFLLVGAHAYLSGKRAIMYICAALSLFTYETVFPLFLVIPLLSSSPDLHKGRDLARHTLVLTVLFASAVLLRLASGESRVEGLEFPVLILTPLRHVLVGPIVSTGMYLYRPALVLRSFELTPLIGASVAAIIIGIFLSRQATSGWPGFRSFQRLGRSVLRQVRWLFSGSDGPATRTDKGLMWPRLLLAGLLMLLLAYPLTFTNRSFSIDGRGSRVHLAAVVGAALLFALLAETLLLWARKESWRSLAISLISIWLGLLLAFGVHVQWDYVHAWDQEQRFWTSLVPLIADAGENNVVLVEPYGLRGPQQIDANTWNMPVVLEQIFQFPEAWTRPPRVYRLVPGWQDHLLQPDAEFLLSDLTITSSASFYRKVPPRQTIFIEIRDERPARVEGPLLVNGSQISLKAPGPASLADRPHGPLYDLLILSE